MEAVAFVVVTMVDAWICVSYVILSDNSMKSPCCVYNVVQGTEIVLGYCMSSVIHVVVESKVEALNLQG